MTRHVTWLQSGKEIALRLEDVLRASDIGNGRTLVSMRSGVQHVIEEPYETFEKALEAVQTP